MVFLITYAFEEPTRDYSPLYESIKSLGPWMHYIESTWLVSTTDMTARQIFDELSPHIDNENDYLLIIRVSKAYWGLLPEEAWDWLPKAFTTGGKPKA